VNVDDFGKPVESLTDRELVEQYDILRRIQDRRRRRAATDDATERQASDDATVRRLLDSLDEPETS
jgi:hypothetical protein